MINKALKDFIEAINARDNGTEAYDTQAQVMRVEGRTAWVHIPGGIDETPVELTIAAKAGDNVQIRVANGQAWLTGNGSAPPTDDTTANTAKHTADGASKTAKAASETAEEAKEAVDGVVQHFWHDATGAHIKDSDDSCQNNLTSDGMALVDVESGNYIAQFLKNVVRFFTNNALSATAALEFRDDGDSPIPSSNPGAKLEYMRTASQPVHGVLTVTVDEFAVDCTRGINFVDSRGNITFNGKTFAEIIGGYLGVEEFTCTRTSAASSGSAKGVYDKAAGTVRLWGEWANSANVTSGTALFTVPTDYRPSANQQGYGMLRTSGDVPLPSNYNATATGNITQTGSSQARGGFFYIEYVL